MSAPFVYLILGSALLLAVVLPSLVQRAPLSEPMVLVLVGLLIGLLPLSDLALDPLENLTLVEHFTEFTVLVALMGVGLALDRPLSLKNLRSWRAWTATWKLLGMAMPLCIAAVFGLGWGLLGLTPGAALLLGAALSPTDPVLASDVQVAGPSVRSPGSDHEADDQEHADTAENIDERDEVRFALTSEAGLNDGLAFPFVHAAIFVAGGATFTEWGLQFVVWDLIGRVVLGVLVGVGVGWVLARLAFRSRRRSLRMAERGDPLLALAALLVVYGASELTGGYGFIAVFCAGMTIRAAESRHEYNASMHQVVERLERLLTLIVLLLLGIAMTHGLLAALDWRGVLVAFALIVVIRPIAGLVAFTAGARGLSSDSSPKPVQVARVERRERLVTAFFGVRGVGSLYYLAYALQQETFSDQRWLWSTVAFTILLSVVLHGILATPAMRWLENHRDQVQDH